LILSHGWNATAFQTLERGYRYFFPDPDACVAYVDTGGAWVAAGAPIAPDARVADACDEFLRAARGVGRRACLFAVEKRLLDYCTPRLRGFAIGEQPIWDPEEWARVVSEHKSLREQLRRARAKGVVVRELGGAELAAGPMRAALLGVAQRWLATRGMAPLGFLVQVEPFGFLPDRHWFVAERQGQPLAFAGVVPVPRRAGWFLEDLLRDPQAPNGTSELLIDAVMVWAKARGSRWVTLGLAPLAGSVAPPLALVRRSSALYDFAGLWRYKAKLRPSAWAPLYLAFPSGQSALLSLYDSLVAFAPGGLLAFALRTLARGPLSAIRVLAVLLLPWTALVASAPSERWFYRPLTQWFWVIFDLVLAAGLFRLLRRPTVGLGLLLAAAVSADSALTALEAGAWLLQHPADWLDWSVLLVAWAAPTFAAFLLWGASRRLRALTRGGGGPPAA
jgi:phosphatidylglycerol lysyltransferase